MARDGERGRDDWKARLGSQNGDPYAEAPGDAPVDLMAVRRDDALIDAIAGDGPVATDSSEEYQLASLLADWRAEIVDAPLPAAPDLDAIVAAVTSEISAREARVGAGRSNLRLVRPLMGAAAAVALIAGGMTAFSYNANPGDPLWRVKEVVFSEQAQTTIAQRADDDMSKAQSMIDNNQPEQAQAALQSAAGNATQINDGNRKKELADRWAQILQQLQTLAPSAAAAAAAAVPSFTLPSVTPASPGSTTPATPGKNTGPTTPSKPVDSSMFSTEPVNPLPGISEPGGTEPGSVPSQAPHSPLPLPGTTPSGEVPPVEGNPVTPSQAPVPVKPPVSSEAPAPAPAPATVPGAESPAPHPASPAVPTTVPQISNLMPDIAPR